MSKDDKLRILGSKNPDTEPWLKLNKDSHNPNLDPLAIDLPEETYLIWRPSTPEEKELDSKIIRPDGEMVSYRHVPNCAICVKAPKDSKYQKGQYLFWTYVGYDSEKPQPVVFDFTDNQPTYFLLKEKHIMGATHGVASVATELH